MLRPGDLGSLWAAVCRECKARYIAEQAFTRAGALTALAAANWQETARGWTCPACQAKKA